MSKVRSTAKIIPLPTKPAAWLIEVSTEALIDEKPVGIEEICKELQLSKPTVVSLIYDKKMPLPGKKMGGRWEFYLTLVRAWRANRQLQ